MATASYEIRWGSGFEREKERELARPILDSASQIALESLEEFRIPLTRPKRIHVKLVKPSEKAYGESCPGTDTIRLYIKPRLLTAKRPYIKGLAGTMMHESIHSTRGETFGLDGDDTYFERAATEGIAYSADYFYDRMMYPNWPRSRRAERIMALPQDKIDQLRYDFIEAGFSHEVFDEDDNFSKWLERGHLTRSRIGMTIGEIIGVRAIMSHLEQGSQFRNLMRISSEELLDI